MKKAFYSLFKIYPGEERQAVLLALLGFLYALAVSLALRFSDVMFLLHVGSDHLPTVYTLSSLVMIILASFLLYAYHNIATHKVYLSIIGTAAFAYGTIFLMVQAGWDESPLWYGMRIIGTLCMAVFSTGYWTFVDQYYTLQDAKRLFSLFSSSIFLGIATTGFIMQAGQLELNAILGLVTLILFAVGLIVWDAQRRLTPVHDENSLQESASQGDIPIRSIFQMVLRSRFTLLLMASNFLIYVTMIVTEFNYLGSFEEHFPAEGLPPGEGEQTPLAMFLGRCLIGISLANMMIGLFVYSRLVYRFSVAGVLPITGAILLFNYLGWMTSESIIYAVVGLTVVEGTLYVIDDSNFNILLNAVPSRIKYRVRIIIESFFEPSGMLVSSFLLSTLPINSKFLGFLLAIAILTLAALLIHNYGKAIYSNLAENAIHFHRSVREWIEPKSEKLSLLHRQQLVRQLESDDEGLSMLAIQGLLALEDHALLEKVLHKMDRATPAAMARLVELLRKSPFQDDPSVIHAYSQWYDDETDEELLALLFFELARGGFIHPEKALHLLESPILMLKGAAIAALKKSRAHLPPVQATQYRLKAVQKQQELINSAKEDEVVMGLTLIGIDGASHDAELLVPFLKDRRTPVAVKAMETFAQLADFRCFRYARLLTSQLDKSSNTDYRQACITALGKVAGSSAVEAIITTSEHLRPHERRTAENVILGMGLRTVPILLSLTKNTRLRDRCRILAVRILSHLAVPQLHANLNSIVRQEIQRAAFYFYQCKTIEKNNPGIDLTLLREALETGYRSTIDFIIHLLGEAGEIEDCELLARSLVSRNGKVRGQAVETLEKSCPHAIFRMLLPFTADIPLEDKLLACENYQGVKADLPTLLEKMSSSHSPLEAMVAAMYMRQLHIPRWRETVLKQMRSHEEIFHHFAYELLEA